MALLEIKLAIADDNKFLVKDSHFNRQLYVQKVVFSEKTDCQGPNKATQKQASTAEIN